MDFNKVCAILVREPFRLTVDQIRKLTPYQVQRIYATNPREQSGSSPPSNFFSQPPK